MTSRFFKPGKIWLLGLFALLFMAACSPAASVVEEPVVDGQRPLVITVFKPET